MREPFGIEFLEHGIKMWNKNVINSAQREDVEVLAGDHAPVIKLAVGGPHWFSSIPGHSGCMPFHSRTFHFVFDKPCLARMKFLLNCLYVILIYAHLDQPSKVCVCVGVCGVCSNSVLIGLSVGAGFQVLYCL